MKAAAGFSNFEILPLAYRLANFVTVGSKYPVDLRSLPYAGYIQYSHLRYSVFYAYSMVTVFDFFSKPDVKNTVGLGYSLR